MHAGGEFPRKERDAAHARERVTFHGWQGVEKLSTLLAVRSTRTLLPQSAQRADTAMTKSENHEPGTATWGSYSGGGPLFPS
jgi:hypothetical protein